MKRLLPRLALAALVALAIPAAAQEPAGREGTGRGTLRGYANPSAAIAAELALDRDVQARGQGTALAAAAAPQAVVFTPRLVWAHGWLKGRANPPAVPRWLVRQVWSSCDGSLVLGRGDWQDSGGQAGWYTRLWQRQADGRYKWLAMNSGPLAHGEAEPDMIAAAVADCPVRAPRMDEGDRQRHGIPPKPPKTKALPPLDPLHHAGASADGTLRWEARVDPAGGQQLSAFWRKGGAEQVLPTGPAAN